MRTHHRGAEAKQGWQAVVRLLMIALAVGAVVKELRTPPADRAWNGVVAGFVPYDFRFPTFARLRDRMWDPDSSRLLNPRAFGVGWTVNVGRVVELLREGYRAGA